MTMSPAEGPHEGSVFFPIPDGTGLLYNLAGHVSTLRRAVLRVAGGWFGGVNVYRCLLSTRRKLLEVG